VHLFGFIKKKKIKIFVHTRHEIRIYIWLYSVNSVPMFVVEICLFHSNAETCSFYVQYH